MTDCVDHGMCGTRAYYNNVWSPELKKVVGQHRIVYCEYNHVGLLSIKGKVVRHTCDNPRCINPEHLVIGTHKDNSQDMVQRGRQVKHCGSEHTMSKLTEEQATFIREHYVPGDKEFGCRALARRFGVAHPNVSRIINGRGYCG